MPNFFNQLVNFAATEDPVTRVLLTLALLVVGHLGVKIVKIAGREFWTETDEITKKEVERRYESLRHFGYILDAIVIILGLLYLNSSLGSRIGSEIAMILPDLLSATLVAILGLIAVNVGVKLTTDLFQTLGGRSYFREIGLSDTAVEFIAMLVKGFLYLLILQVALSEIGIGGTFLDKMVTASSWAGAFLVAGLIFYGLKDLFRNLAAGIYLKNSRLMRPGEEVTLDEEKGEINHVSLFSTSINTKEGYTMLAPNSRLMDAEIKFRRAKSDIDTLEEIKEYFVAQHPSYCGPAAMEMALEIFGYRHSQDEIGEKAGTEREKGTGVEELCEAVEELTNGQVKTAFIEFDRIGDLGDEFKAWFNDGALIVPNFYKPAVFPEQDSYGGHYVLSPGVEGSEVLMVDPSDKSGTGGVYYVDAERLREAMDEYGHKRGYIIVAPKGTNAYWRIENGLIYSEKNYYDELSKTLEARLRKIVRQGRLLQSVMPGSAEEYMEKWRSDEPVTRLWKSDEGEGNETTDDS